MSNRRRFPRVLSALGLLAAAALTVTVLSNASSNADEPDTNADGVLRVYNNNIENLVLNNSDGSCTRVSGPDHLKSMLVDDEGKTGTDGVKPPDVLTVQQVRGEGQATAYADQLSEKFGYSAGTYKAIVAWDDPQTWGGSHNCDDQDLGNLKKKQTNAIIYNTKTLDLAEGDTSKYWSAGWLKPGTAYKDGAGCTMYKNNEDGANYKYKWKRTSAIAARFTIKGTETSVFAATMHLPQENRKHACAGDGDTGIDDSGIKVGADATKLMNDSKIRVIGIDANRTKIDKATLDEFDMTGYGAKPTGSSKIDYFFTNGVVQPSKIDHTIDSTKSNHLALYGFIEY